MTFKEIKDIYINEIISKRLTNNKKESEKLFLDSLSRAVVSNTILEMCEFIVENGGNHNE